MSKPKRDKLWINDMWEVDEDMGCHCCYQYYNGKCNAPGGRFDRGYCEVFIHRDVYNHKPEHDEYEEYMNNWN